MELFLEALAHVQLRNIHCLGPHDNVEQHFHTVRFAAEAAELDSWLPV